MGLLTKAWSCPACANEFIVAAEATKDTCPWCQTSVEERSGELTRAGARADSDRRDMRRGPSVEYDEQLEATLFPGIGRRPNPKSDGTPAARQDPPRARIGQDDDEGSANGCQDGDAPPGRPPLSERTDVEQMSFVDHPCSAQQAVRHWPNRIL